MFSLFDGAEVIKGVAVLWKVMLPGALFTLVFFLVLRLPGTELWAKLRLAQLRLMWRILCGIFVLLVVGCGLVAVVTERIRFFEEATVLSTVAAFWHGQALYPSTQAPVEYGLLYGPVTYFMYLPPMMGGALRLWGYEAWALGALGGTFLLLFLALRRKFGVSVALGSAALLAANVARFTGNEWAIKADVWILLFSALSFWASSRLQSWTAACVIAVAGAMLVDLKATLLLIALLPFVLLWQRERSARVPVVVFALLLPLLALLPFSLPGVSLSNYVRLLLEYKSHATSARVLAINTQMTLIIFLPTFTLLWAAMSVAPRTACSWIRERSAYLVILIVACVVATVTGAKEGGGPWHCVVLVIPSLFVDAELWRLAAPTELPSLFQNPRRFAPILGVSLALFVTGLKLLAGGVKERLYDQPGDTPVSMRDVENDLLAISQRYPGETIQMGYSDRAHFNLTNVRPILYVRGNPLFVDPQARNEADVIGKPISPEVLNALARCKIQLWVIPKGAEPFSMESMYWLDPTVDRKGMEAALYPANFRQTFFEHYREIQQTSRYFNVWACQNTDASAAHG